MKQRRFSQGIHVKSDIKKFFMVEMVSAVKKNRRLFHGIIYFLVIQCPVLFPLRHQSQAMGAFSR